MDYTYELPSYADIFDMPVITEVKCTRFAATITEFVEKYVKYYFSDFEGLMRHAEADETSDALDRIQRLHRILAPMASCTHRAFITAYMQKQINWNDTVSKKQLADYYIDEYEDENGPYIGMVYDIAETVPLVKWTADLKGCDIITKNVALEYLANHLHYIWSQYHDIMMNIEHLINYGH
jgi:hypothetical protein